MTTSGATIFTTCTQSLSQPKDGILHMTLAGSMHSCPSRGDRWSGAPPVLPRVELRKVQATSTLSPNSSNTFDISTRCRVIRGCLRIRPPCCSPSWRTRWVRLPRAALHDLRRATCKAAPNHPRPSVLPIGRAIGVRVLSSVLKIDNSR